MPQESCIPICVPVPESKRYARKVVRGMNFDCITLTIDIEVEGPALARVIFHDVRGLRILDESDLTEFWNTYSEPNGWLWEVKSGGWYDLERTRSTFLSQHMIAGLREFFIADDTCISVLCTSPPELVNFRDREHHDV